MNFRLVIPGLLGWLALGLVVCHPLGAATITLQPLGEVPTVGIGRTAKSYLVIARDPVVIPVVGPGTVTFYARVPMPTDTTDHRIGVLTIGGLTPADLDFPLEFLPSSSTGWADGRPGNPSAGTKSSFDVPAGEYSLKLRSVVPGGDPMLLILYYDGPAQPALPGLMQPPAPIQVPGAAAAKKVSPWSFRGGVGLDIIYNDNILTNSPEDLEAFIEGTSPWKFLQESNDDLVLGLSLDLQARRDFFSWGQTRFTFKVKRWEYTHNPIKTNTDFHFYGRQYFGRNQSLEGYFHFAPEQYIGQLSDRSPLDDPDADIVWTDFRFQRNTWNLTWRQKITSKLAGKIIYEENYRYYNQPFIENDISAKELRLNASYRINRTYTVDLDYSFEDGNGRGLDEVGEDILTSDNSDPSYERDLYRIGLSINPRSLRKYFDGIDLSFLFMDYYYTTTKSLAQDPYHAGRRDTYYKGTIEVGRDLTKNLSASAAVRYTERVVYSPWEGDITTDKDFTQWLYWISLNYGF